MILLWVIPLLFVGMFVLIMVEAICSIIQDLFF